MVRAAGRSAPLAQAAASGEVVAEDTMEYGDLAKKMQQSTFGAHFVEVGVDAFTGEVRVRRMLAVCAAGRILNPKSARSQVIGAMTMGVGGALMEELAVDKRLGFFVNHDLAGYEVPVHADIPHQDVIFLDETDPTSSPMKAKGVGELGICGVSAAIANADIQRERRARTGVPHHARQGVGGASRRGLTDPVRSCRGGNPASGNALEHHIRLQGTGRAGHRRGLRHGARYGARIRQGGSGRHAGGRE
jgi:hypothetical protein